MPLMQNCHFCVFEPALVCSTNCIWSLHPQKYKKLFIFIGNCPEKKCQLLKFGNNVRMFIATICMVKM